MRRGKSRDYAVRASIVACSSAGSCVLTALALLHLFR